ncbi:MAG: methyltransferase domain-containing protein [Alphaproteobacteria bacterium]
MTDNSSFDRLRCPETGARLVRDGDVLRAESSARSYRLNDLGVPLFAESFLSSDAERQRDHYDRIAAAYVEHLDYPHTEVYTDYLDRALYEAIGTRDLGVTAELCCGRGEALRLLSDRIREGIGVDISEEMLNAAIHEGVRDTWTLVQGDATKVPLADESVDSVVMLGGIHHVNDRDGLFREIARILKPGGRFYWREPVSDFLLWRGLRALIYRLSPALDHETERPLRYIETRQPLDDAGLTLDHWRTYGYAGFCLFMNSDVLVFNRLFRFLPGIRALTRFSVWVDDVLARTPGMRMRGLQVVGVASKKDEAT